MSFKKVADAFRNLADAIEEIDPKMLAEIQAEQEGDENVEEKKSKKTATKKKTAKTTKKTSKKKEPKTEAKEFTESDVRGAIKIYAKANGRDQAFEILGEFGANKVADLKKEDYAAVMEKIQ